MSDQVTQSGDPMLGRAVGNYFVEKKLGEGGMGAVYRLKHTALPNTHKVLKTLLRSGGSEAAMQRFQQEAHVAPIVGTERVVRVDDFGSFPDGTPYIVMEFIDGGDLGGYLAQNGPLPIDVTQPDLNGADFTPGPDMTQPVCTPAARRCNPTDHSHEQVCDAQGFWQDSPCPTGTVPAWACTDLKGRCVDVAWTQWTFTGPTPAPGTQFTTVSDPTGNGQDMVADSYTGLLWQQHSPTTTFAFSDAVSYCVALNYGGYSDWRLPTVVELLSIQDMSKSTCAPTMGIAYAVDFSTGASSQTNTTTTYRARCVH